MEPKEKFEISEMKKFLEKHELHHTHSDVLERIITLVIAALGLIAALAWDEVLNISLKNFSVVRTHYWKKFHMRW